MFARNYGLAVAAMGFPQFHSLAKSPGDGIDASWDAENTGDESGTVWLEINFDGVLIASGVAFSVNPGSIQNLSVSASVPTDAIDGLHNGDLIMMAQDLSGNVFEVARHSFSVDVAVPVGLVITPVGDPVIS